MIGVIKLEIRYGLLQQSQVYNTNEQTVLKLARG
jgi:hypothetical protein